MKYFLFLFLNSFVYGEYLYIKPTHNPTILYKYINDNYSSNVQSKINSIKIYERLIYYDNYVKYEVYGYINIFKYHSDIYISNRGDWIEILNHEIMHLMYDTIKNKYPKLFDIFIKYFLHFNNYITDGILEEISNVYMINKSYKDVPTISFNLYNKMNILCWILHKVNFTKCNPFYLG